MLRDQINEALKNAMRQKDERVVSTVRLVISKMKDLDIAARPKGNATGINDDEIRSMLQGMIKQRRESVGLYEKGNRPDLVQKETQEIAIIERFLPQQMSEADTQAAIRQILSETGAKDIKDMGRVMAELKKKYAGQMDFAQASSLVKNQLTS